MSIASNKLFYFDTLVLSNSPSPLSSSTSSLFIHGHLSSHSGSSPADRSSTRSTLQEDEECLRRFDSKSLTTNCFQRAHDAIPGMPKHDPIFSVAHRAQGPEYLEVYVGEAGYEAGVSDGDEGDIMLVPLAIRKKRSAKKSLLEGISPGRTTSFMSTNEDELKPSIYSPSFTLQGGEDMPGTPQGAPVMKPALCPRLYDLNSPSPMISLPSPRLRGSSPSIPPRSHKLCNLSSFQLKLPAGPYPTTQGIDNQFDVQEVIPGKTNQMLGLGLRIPGSQSPCHPLAKSCHSSLPETSKVKTFIGLGISSFSPTPSGPLHVPVTAKHYSLSGLGHGLPSTLRPSSCAQESGRILSCERTAQLVTQRKLDGDKCTFNRVSDSASSVVRRRVSVSIDSTLSQEDSLFLGRDLYAIPESPTSPTTSESTFLSTSSSSTSFVACDVFAASMSTLLLQNAADIESQEAMGTTSPCSPRILCSLLQQRRFSPTILVDHGYTKLENRICSTIIESHLLIRTSIGKPLF